IEVLHCRDILRFLGRQMPAHTFDPRFQGEVKSDLRQRHEGVRLKMWYGANSVKAYDFAPTGLRLETTVNQPYGFTVFRTKEGDDPGPAQWRPLRKGVADL